MQRLLQYALMFPAPAVQLYLVVLMLRRDLRRTYPAFFVYSIFSTVAFAAEFVTYHFSQNAYFCLYWVASALGVMLGFAVIHEIFHSVFRPYESLKELASVLFRWAMIVVALVAIITVASGNASIDGRIMQMIVGLERSVRVMQVGLLLFLFLFAAHVGLTARSHVFGIALGFGLFASLELIHMMVYAVVGSVYSAPLNLLKSIAYNVSAFIWLLYLRAPEPERVAVDYRARSVDWNLALQSANEGQHESFLPMIESAVERILEKREAELHARG